mgnify:FL=1
MNVCCILASGMLALIFAALGYMGMTWGMGTPLKDSLTPDQLAIKAKSAGKRQQVYIIALVAAVGLVMLWNPFGRCSKQ